METENPNKNPLWKNIIFTKMMTSFTMSSFGGWFDMIAVIILFSYVWKVDPVIIALVPITFALPGVFLGQVAGVLADRFKKMRLMLIADLLRAGLTIVLLFAPNPYWALPIMLLRSTAAIINSPAQQALLRTIVDKDQLLSANVMIGAVSQISKILAPFLGSFVIALFSVKVCLIVNAACLLLSALVLMTVGRISEEEENLNNSTDNQQGIMTSWKQGWKLLITSRILLISTIFHLVGFAGIQLVDAQLSVLLRDVRPNQPELVGYVITAVGLGTFTVGGIMIRKKDIKSYGWAIAGGILLIGLSFTGLGMFPSGGWIFWLLVLGLITGCGTGMSVITFNYLRQKETPVASVGRLTGITNSLTSAMIIVGPLAGGFLVRSFSVHSAFLIAGIFLSVLGITGLVLKNWIWARHPASPSDKNHKSADNQVVGGKL